MTSRVMLGGLYGRRSLGCHQRRIQRSASDATDYTQTRADHGVLASVGSVGDAYDTRFVNTFKTELIADRVWRTRARLELAIVEYVGWYNDARLHESLGDIPSCEVRDS